VRADTGGVRVAVHDYTKTLLRAAGEVGRLDVAD
jgi:hypothetical protein